MTAPVARGHAFHLLSDQERGAGHIASFRRFKDRGWGLYEATARALARAPAPIGRFGFSALVAAAWIAYLPPASTTRRTIVALSRLTDRTPPRKLFADMLSRLSLGAWLLERMRARPDEGIGMPLRVPEEARLDVLIGTSGGVIVMPHTAAAFPVARGLAQRYPLTVLVRTTRDRRRSEAQFAHYAALGCEIIDARSAGKAVVARGLLRALKAGRLVIGMGDLIASPPAAHDTGTMSEHFRVDTFGQVAGVVGWPARFALSTGVPLVPAMAVFDAGGIVLHLGPTAHGSDPAALTRSWFGAMLDLVQDHPEDWPFALDRRWARILRTAAAEETSAAARDLA
jgi:KDO2-lipid IV(A) lauroyltransferase